MKLQYPIPCIRAEPNSAEIFYVRFVQRESSYTGQLCDLSNQRKTSTGANFLKLAQNEKMNKIHLLLKVAIWINENFLLQEEIQVDTNGRLNARFFSLRGSGMLFVEMENTGEVNKFQKLRCAMHF